MLESYEQRQICWNIALLSPTAYHRTAGYASGGVTKDKEPLKKAKTPQGRFDMDENESKSKDVLKSKNTRHLCYTVIL